MKLFEIERKKQQAPETQETATKTKQRSKLDLGPEFFTPPKFHAPEKTKGGEIKPHVAGGEVTRAKTAGVSLPAGAGEKLAALHAAGLEDEISDTEAARRAGVEHSVEHRTGSTTKDVKPEDTEGALVLPKTPENLPAIINKHISKKHPFNPEWHLVKNLPGYMQAPIRALGREVFKVFTSTDIEDINILANVNNQGPNGKQEIDATAKWILQHGHEITDANINFHKTIPGYDADVKVYHALGYTFLLVKDFAGEYIYSWPLSKDKSGQTQERLT